MCQWERYCLFEITIVAPVGKAEVLTILITLDVFLKLRSLLTFEGECKGFKNMTSFAPSSVRFEMGIGQCFGRFEGSDDIQ